MQRVNNIEPATEPDPIPLTGLPPSEPFPVTALSSPASPSPLAVMVEAVAEATQTDPAMAGTSVLSVLAASAGGRAEVEARKGWREPLCLNTATIARPGERKSAVQAAMVTPLLDAEQELAEAGAAQRIEAETAQMAVKASDRARTVAGAADPDKRDAALADAIGAAAMVEAITVPPIPRIVADDVTPEAAGSLLAEQGGRLAIISAEGGIFDIIAGRYSSNVPNLDVFLKGHAGDPLKVDRRGRPPEYVRRPAVTVGVMIQPAVLASIGRHSTFRGRDLLARFLYSHPVSKVGHRKAGATPVPEEVAQNYHRTITALVKGLAGEGTDPAILTLTPQAAAGVIRIEEAIEPQLGEDGALSALADWGSKYVGAVLRITALLHLADLGAEAAIRTPIPAQTLLRGNTIGEYFKSQAVAAFGEMQTDEATADAVYLLARLGKHPEQTASVRDMQRLAKRFKTRDDIEAPMQRLIDTGWLIPLETEVDGHAGRPPSPTYRIHPMARDRGTQGPQVTEQAA